MSSTLLYYDHLFETLKNVKKPGSFAAGGSTVLPLPALKINGMPGQIGLPLTEFQAKDIAEKCSQAPFGRGEKTIVDTSVRKTWQLNPTQFSIENKKWPTSLAVLVDQVRTQLGCDAAQNISCELYKLLLYEPGGFFKPHRDTEKAQGMFGTLVIQLPSDYEGGQLVVQHQQKKQTFDFSSIEGSTGFHYAAFYADCQHEILEVTKGYRLCLIYNLISRASGLPLPVPKDKNRLVSQVVESMTKWDADKKGPSMMAYILEHQYCDASLSFSALKNGDRAVADVLQQARIVANFDLYLTSVTKTECWSSYHECGEDAFCDGSCGDYREIELCDSELSAGGWATPDGKRDSDLGELNLDESFLMPPGVLDDAKPDSEEFQEATGNEGSTIDKTYHRASLIVWPLSRRLAVLGLDRMVKKLEKSIPNQSVVLKDPKKQKEFQELVKTLVELTKKRDPSVPSVVSLLRCLCVSHDHKLANALLMNVFATSDNYSSSSCVGNCDFGDQLLATCRVLGWSALQSGLHQLFESKVSMKIEDCCQLLFKLVGGESQAVLKPDQQEICQQLADIVSNALVQEQDIEAPSCSWGYQYITTRTTNFVSQIVKALTILHCDTQLEAVIESFFRQKNRYPLVTVLASAAQELNLGVNKNSLLLSHCIKALEARSTLVAAEQTSWSQNVFLGCFCSECKTLEAFLAHPKQTQIGFKVNKTKRQHIQRQLILHRCDTTDQTTSLGRPLTLVVTKTQNVRNAKQQQRQTDLMVLTQLRHLAQSVSGANPTPKRTKVAVAEP